jgi:hypothetical protein
MPQFGEKALDLDVVTQALKEHYKPLTVKNMVYKDNPLLALMPKYEKFGGSNMPIPVQYGISNRRSANFGNAKATESATSLARFVIERVKDYSFASIDGETIKATESNADAFLKYATMEIDGAIHSLSRSLAVGMYRDGTGSIGQSGGTATGPVASVTLKATDDITNFEVGMVIETYADSSGAPSGSVVDTKRVFTVDRENGILTFCDVTGSVSSSTNITLPGTAGGHLVPRGDLNAKMKGLDAWLPATAPTSGDSFFSVDRSSDSSRLAGIRFDGSSMPIEEALISAAVRTAREGGSPEYCFMNYDQYANLEKALGSKVVYDKVSSDDADIGFQALSIIGPKGSIKVIPDQNCEPDIAYLLQLDTWTLNSLGPAPHILDLDGNRMLRETDADAYELRVGFYGNLACNAPGYNCRVKLA